MGKDDIFKKKRAERRKRKFENRQPHAHSYLIICEGKETEPNYFNGLNTKIQKKIGGQIKIESIPIIDVIGEGQNTTSLVNIVEKRVKEAKIIYENIWIVFDKDDFEQFDKAIKEAESKEYKVAWSNECFELWLLLHFCYIDSALSRKVLFQKMTEIYNDYGYNHNYQKNDPNIYKFCSEIGSVKNAIGNSKRLMSNYKPSLSPSKCSPGNTVYQLVEELIGYLN